MCQGILKLSCFFFYMYIIFFCCCCYCCCRSNLIFFYSSCIIAYKEKDLFSYHPLHTKKKKKSWIGQLTPQFFTEFKLGDWEILAIKFCTLFLLYLLPQFLGKVLTILMPIHGGSEMVALMIQHIWVLQESSKVEIIKWIHPTKFRIEIPLSKQVMI